MLLWFAGMSVVVVWAVFRDPAIDYRLVMAGAVAPDVVDRLAGGAGPLHAVTGAVVLLVAVMLGTIGRRAARRRLLALPIGLFLHLVLDAAFADTAVFWWPFSGVGLPSGPVPAVERALAVNLGLEAAGAVALVWAWRRFGLADPARRRQFARTGHVDRSLA